MPSLFLVTALLVLAVQHTSSQKLGDIYNVTVQQEIPATVKYVVNTENHTLQVGRRSLVCIQIHTRRDALKCAGRVLI